MKINKTKRFVMGRLSGVVCGLLAAAFFILHPALAQDLIPPSEDVGSIPDFAGTGLFGLYYDNNAGYSSAAGSPPEASFTTTNLCFPNCLGGGFDDSIGGLQAFTNGSATNFNFFTSIEPVRTTWDGSELDMTGYIAITQAGTYTFNATHDDNFLMTIGGVGQQFTCCGTNTIQDTFTAPGLYRISVQFMEGGGGSILSLTGSDPGGNCILGCYDGNGNLEANDLFYSDEDLSGAPAPVIGGGLPAMVLAGLVGIAGVRRRRAALSLSVPSTRGACRA
jgi:hypothetical protein